MWLLAIYVNGLIYCFQGLVKNCSENENEKAQEKIDTEKEEVVSEGGEGFDNATITPQSSRLVDIEDKTWLLK